MAFLAPLLTAGLGALGGIFGNRPQTTNSNGLTQWNSQNSSTPVWSQQQQGIFDPLALAFQQQLSKDPDFSKYEGSQAWNINKQSDIAGQNIAESLASRGISGPAVGTALAGNEENRGAQLTNLHGSIPLLQQQFMDNMLNIGTNLFKSIPFGQQNNASGNQATQGTNTQSGNMLGGLFGNLAPILAALFGMNSGGGNNPGLSPASAAGTGGEPV